MVKVEGKKKCFTEQIYNLILFFFFLFFSNNIRDDIPWQNLGMTAGRLGNSVEVLYFGVWSILYLQRSGRKEPGKRAGEMVRE